MIAQPAMKHDLIIGITSDHQTTMSRPSPLIRWCRFAFRNGASLDAPLRNATRPPDYSWLVMSV